MIYLDNAATTYPKPASVRYAINTAMERYGANPGRAGHSMSMAAAEEVYRCRSAAVDFFHAPGPECVAFTLNCTHALNYVLKGLLKPGDHVVTSCLEHNAVVRPLQALSEKGVEFTRARVFPGNDAATLQSFGESIRNNTKLIVCTHVSNVWGIRLPVAGISKLAHEKGIPLAVDCAQSAGVLPINMTADGIDYLCVAGHKGLYGPMGTGMLITSKGSELNTIIEGGTGTNSSEARQPTTMPDRLESGTQNMPGIAGLHAGIEFVKFHGVNGIFRHEMNLVRLAYKRLSEMRRVKLYTPEPSAPGFVPVLSFNVENIPSEVIGRKLSERGVAVRAGLHCAPDAHRFMGTLEQGSVRLCPSVFTTAAEISGFVSALQRII